MCARANLGRCQTAPASALCRCAPQSKWQRSQRTPSLDYRSKSTNQETLTGQSSFSFCFSVCGALSLFSGCDARKFNFCFLSTNTLQLFLKKKKKKQKIRFIQESFRYYGCIYLISVFFFSVNFHGFLFLYIFLYIELRSLIDC